MPEKEPTVQSAKLNLGHDEECRGNHSDRKHLWRRLVPHGGDGRADSLRRTERCMRSAVRVPSEPHHGKGHDKRAAPTIPRIEHQRNRLRPRSERSEPVEPLEAAVVERSDRKEPRRASERQNLDEKRRS